MARVLLIEPDKILSNICVQALQRAGHIVDVANEAQEAVHLADEHKPDVVITEVQLKKHNGVEFLYEFRSYDEWLDVPVIVHSFVPPTEFAGMSVFYEELGVNTYLYKPTTSLAKLIHTVETLLPAVVT